MNSFSLPSPLSRLSPLAIGLALACVALAAPQSLPGVHQAATPTPERAPLRVLVPAYFYPVTNSPWVRLIAKAAQFPGRVWAIGNPFNGPGTSFDATYAQTFQAFRQAGGRMLGYVSTNYGNVPAAQVRADIDQWIAWYPLDGFFLDEMDNVPLAHEAYYQGLRDYARSRLPGAFVVSNPGTSTVESYLATNGHPVVDTLCVFETGAGFLAWTPDAWMSRWRSRNFYVLPYGIGAAQWHACVDHALASNCAWIYVTDDVLPNPWDTLPAYFETFVDDVMAR